ncbi:hypothetical protein [Acinetobacter phage Ab69]|nr:hypothetical protein [Acinetobacter phage Ab69]
MRILEVSKFQLSRRLERSSLRNAHEKITFTCSSRG